MRQFAARHARFLMVATVISANAVVGSAIVYEARAQSALDMTCQRDGCKCTGTGPGAFCSVTGSGSECISSLKCAEEIES